MKTLVNNHSLERQIELKMQALTENLQQADLETQSDEEQEALRAFLRDFATKQINYDSTFINPQLSKAS